VHYVYYGNPTLGCQRAARGMTTAAVMPQLSF
jgi:hypothetical protein